MTDTSRTRQLLAKLSKSRPKSSNILSSFRVLIGILLTLKVQQIVVSTDESAVPALFINGSDVTYLPWTSDVLFRS